MHQYLPEITKLYQSNHTLENIGRQFGISKQRVWQIIKSNQVAQGNHRRRNKPKKTNTTASESEIWVAETLRCMGFSVVHMPKISHYDLSADGLRIEVKHRSLTDVRISENSPYPYSHYQFTSVRSRFPIDFYILLCGFLPKPATYIFPESNIRSSMSIAEIPVKQSKKWQFLEAWHLLFELGEQG
jgi:hypothetical protein